MFTESREGNILWKRKNWHGKSCIESSRCCGRDKTVGIVGWAGIAHGNVASGAPIYKAALFIWKKSKSLENTRFRKNKLNKVVWHYRNYHGGENMFLFVGVLLFFIIGGILCVYTIRRYIQYYKANNYQNSRYSGINRKKMDFYSKKNQQEILRILKTKQANDVFKYEISSTGNRIFLKVSNITKKVLWKPDRDVTYEIKSNGSGDGATHLCIEVIDYDSWWSMTEYGSVMGEFLHKKIELI